jgi:hypothetical protein
MCSCIEINCSGSGDGATEGGPVDGARFHHGIASDGLLLAAKRDPTTTVGRVMEPI